MKLQKLQILSDLFHNCTFKRVDTGREGVCGGEMRRDERTQDADFVYEEASLERAD